MLCFLSRICFFIVSLENPYLFFEAQMGLHLFFSHLLFPQYWMCNSAWVLPSLYGAVYLSLFFLLDLQDFLRSGIHFSCLCILNTPSIEPDSWVALKKYCQYLIKLNIESVCFLELQEGQGNQNLAAASTERKTCQALISCDHLLSRLSPQTHCRVLGTMLSESPVQVVEAFEMPETKPLHPLKIVSLVWVW